GGEGGEETGIGGFLGEAEKEGKAWGRSFCCECRRGAHGNDHRHLAAQQFTGHGRQPIVLALRKPILDPQVVPLDVACLRQAESDCRSVGGSCCLQERAKKSDHRHRALLRARRKRPRGRRAAECGEQFPPSDGDCHTPLPCEVRKGKDTTRQACCPNSAAPGADGARPRWRSCPRSRPTTWWRPRQVHVMDSQGCVAARAEACARCFWSARRTSLWPG